MKMPCLVVVALSTSAAAMPPPVPVAPVAVVADGDAHGGDLLLAALKRLGSAGYVELSSGAIPVLEAPQACAASGVCLHLPKAAAAGQVLVFAVDPRRRSAAFAVRCVGADRSRAKSIDLFLSDAATKAPEIAHPQLAKLSGCLMGAAGPR